MITLSRIRRLNFSHLATLTRYLQPINLSTSEVQEIPTLKLKSQKYLLQNWWSESPFDLPPSEALNVPVFSFLNAQFASKQIELPQDIFNCPLRRDLIYRLYDFRIKLNKFTTKVTRNRATTYGSGRKMRPQKGQGLARMGEKRAPHLWKGGKAHGAKARVFSFTLNSKIKINALKALLSAKLAQGKIKIVDTQTLNEGKTKFAASAVNSHAKDERAIVCIITSKNCDQNFEKAQRNIKRLIWHDSYSLDVLSLFKADRILITQKGLEELIENIYKTTYIAYRHPSMAKLEQKKPQPKEEEEVTFDPSQPYEFKFKILAEYMDKYQQLKKQKPHLLQKEISKTAKINELL